MSKGRELTMVMVLKRKTEASEPATTTADVEPRDGPMNPKLVKIAKQVADAYLKRITGKLKRKKKDDE